MFLMEEPFLRRKGNFLSMKGTFLSAKGSFLSGKGTFLSSKRSFLSNVLAAKKMELVVLAGHGLTYRNSDAIATIPKIELHIDHSIISRTALVGLDAACERWRR